MSVSKFVVQHNNNVLVCGLSCIGKSHFYKHFFKKVNQLEDPFFHALNSDVQLNTKFKSILELKSGVIVLGAPWFIWKKRIEERKKGRNKHIPPFCESRTKDNIWFKTSYVKCINKLDMFNIPYILIDYRENCTILDKVSFIKMLT